MANEQREQGAAGEGARSQYGSDLAAEVLRRLGIEYIALNPGASYRGLHDSIVNFGDRLTDNGDPEMIQCTHEEIAIAVAHGYAKASGKLMAAGIHNVVGLQHASMAIFNAWCEREPILVVGGGGPSDMELRRPTEWTHTALVQGNLVRDFVKWDDEPTSHSAVIESLVRGYRIAMTEPRGPVYVCLDAGLQEEALGEDAPAVTPARLAPARPGAAPAPDPEALRVVAEALRSARFPVLLAGRCGDTEEAFADLAALAERWAIPVVDVGGRLNFPTRHAMNLTGDNTAVLSRADVIVAIEVKNLYGALSHNERTARETTPFVDDSARLFAVSLEDYIASGWSAEYQRLCPVELSINAQGHQAVRALLEALGEPESDPGERRSEIAAWHDTLAAGWRHQAEAEWGEHPVAWSALTEALRQVLGSDPFVLANGDGTRSWIRRIFDLTSPTQTLGPSGGAGLGYGLGATIGACLAYRDSDRVVVNLQSDGDLLFTPGALWTYAHHQLPALIVVNNNRSYFNDEEHQKLLARFRGRDETRAYIGTRIESPSVDFARLAESFGVQGFGPVDDADKLVETLHDALAVVREGRPALVDVWTKDR